MKSETYNVIRYDADEGKVFDWADLSAHTTEDEEGHTIVEHLYAKTIYLGVTDSIDNYVEVVAPN